MFSRVLRRFSSQISSLNSAFAPYKFPASVEQALKKNSITRPSDIQKAVWPVIERGKDLVAIGKTGSGKTLGYLLPMVKHVIRRNFNNLSVRKSQKPNSIIILPTRELTIQVANEVAQFCGPAGIKHVSVFGGVSKQDQVFCLNQGVHTCIGTPGRINELLLEKTLRLDNADYLVLDEADMMLDMGFDASVRSIIKMLPEKKQTLMFSATWPDQISALASDLLVNPEKVQIGSSELSMNEDIKHKFIYYEIDDKINQLNTLIHEEPDKKYLIFANTKWVTAKLESFLIENNYKVESLNSDKDQAQRTSAMKMFSSGMSNILIATDVASRGLDIKGIDFVINYDIPSNLDDYIHRVGRTGRAGKKGIAISFFGKDSNKRVMKGIINKLSEVGQQVPYVFKKVALND